MYTFDDWLNDRMQTMENMPDERLNGHFLLGANLLDELCYKHKMIEESELKMIRKYQEKTFDIVAMLYRKKLIDNFNKAIANLSDAAKLEIIKDEIKKWEEEVNPPNPLSETERQKFQVIKDRVLECNKGSKDYRLISGAHYKEAIRLLELANNNENFEIFSFSLPGHLHRIKAITEYLTYLRSLLKPRQKKKGLKSNHSQEILKSIFKAAIDLEYIEGTENNFLAVFSDENLFDDFKPLKWKKVNTRSKIVHCANKSALRDFISVCISGKTGEKDLPRDVSHLFIDMNYEGIRLLKSASRNRYSTYAREFEQIAKTAISQIEKSNLGKTK